MNAEKDSHDFYISLSEHFPPDSSLRKMLIYIAEMEMGHYKLLKIEKENAEKFEACDIEWPMMHIGA
jgi:rubrerythrin